VKTDGRGEGAKISPRGDFTPSKRVVPFAALRQIGAARLKHMESFALCGARLKALP